VKPCPSCGYGNPDSGVRCGICAKDITDVRIKAEPVPEKDPARPGLMLLTGLLLLACGALFFFMQNPPWRKEAPVESGENAVTDENSFDYGGVLYSLGKMEKLRFLPEADKRLVPPLLSSPDDRVAHAAAKTIGAWARSEKDPALGRFWFQTLLDASSSARPAARKQAALEAGMVIALGFPFSDYLEPVRKAAAGLVGEKDPGLKAAGFFLSSMAGLEDFSGQMLETLKYDPSSSAKLYAACALSRLGRSEGYDHLSRAASGGDPANRVEALSCLSYSASPDAGPLLLSVSKDGFDAAAAEAAKRGLILRKQLAIIKK